MNLNWIQLKSQFITEIRSVPKAVLSSLDTNTAPKWALGVFLPIRFRLLFLQVSHTISYFLIVN